MGGLERRTATLYRYLTKKKLDCHVTFMVNRAQFSLISHYKGSLASDNCRLILFGMPWFPFCKGSNTVTYVADYFLLLIKLIFLRVVRQEFDIAYITKFASLPLRHFIPARHKILPLVDSQTTERIIDSKIFEQILAESFTIDCLSNHLRSMVLAKEKSLPEHVFATPCSFIDYSNTRIKKKKKVITFCGRLTEGKGVDLLLAALPELLECHANVEVRILGNGPLLPKVQKIIRALNSDCVSVGFVPDPIVFLQDSLIFLSLQEKENYPSQSLLEAMACGNAVVATDVGSTKQLVNEEVGILIPHDPQKLTLALDCLLKNLESTRQMGILAREKVMTEHTVERYLLYFKHEIMPSLK